jgi:EF hand
MKNSALVLAASVSICAMGGMSASAQQPPGTTVQQGGMMGGGMMRGMMGHRMMAHRAMMGLPLRIIFALMDSDGDGTVSLSEFQAAHEKIFKAMDANKDGVLTMEEMLAFMHGSRGSAPTKAHSQGEDESDNED